MKLLSDRTIETKSKYDYLNLFFFLINGKIRAFLSLNAQVLSAITAMTEDFPSFIKEELQFMQDTLYK